MFEFIKDMRLRGLVTNEILDLYKDIFINQSQYDELKAIKFSVS